MNTRLLVPLIVTAGLLVAVTVNEVTHGGLSEAFGAGHHHVLDHEQAACPGDDPDPGSQVPTGSDEATCPGTGPPEVTP